MPHRLTPLPPSEFSPEQRALYEDVQQVLPLKFSRIQTQTEQGALLGPWNPIIHEPAIGSAIWNLAKVLIVQARLPPNVREVAILTVGAHFNAAYEKYAHSRLAEPVLGAAKVAALSAGRRPPDLSEEEACAFDVARGLMQSGPLPESVYSSAIQFFGQHGVNELIFLIGFYAFVSVVLNGFDEKVP